MNMGYTQKLTGKLLVNHKVYVRKEAIQDPCCSDILEISPSSNRKRAILKQQPLSSLFAALAVQANNNSSSHSFLSLLTDNGMLIFLFYHNKSKQI